MPSTLHGRVVVITRSRADAAPLAAALRARGARVVFAPLVRRLPPRSWRALDAALRGLGTFDAAAFASAAGVEAFFARASRVLGVRPAAPPVVGAVGPATAAALAANGWRASVVPDDARAAGLAAALKVRRGARVLLPRAERGRPELADGLRRAGCRPVPAAAYRTVADPAGGRALRRALAEGADAVCFASGSAAAAAAKALGLAGARRALEGRAVAIGPTTASALKALGIPPAGVAKRPDVESFAASAAAAVGRAS